MNRQRAMGFAAMGLFAQWYMNPVWATWTRSDTQYKARRCARLAKGRLHNGS